MKSINRGFTLIETLITVAIIGVLATLALPSLTSGIVKNNISSASQDLANQFVLARSQAMKSNKIVEISFNDGANWCYGIDHNAEDSNFCTCSAPTSACAKVVNYEDYSSVSLTNSLASGKTKVHFTPNRGRLDSAQATSGQIEFVRDSKTIKVDINVLGKARTCSSDYGGFGAC